MSYLYFTGAMLLLMTSAVCFLLHRERDLLLRWSLLGGSALLLFVKRMIGVVYPAYGADYAFLAADTAALAAGLVLISEAGREAWSLKRSYFYPPMLLFCAFAVPYGFAGLDAAFRISFGLAGAGLVAARLVRARRERPEAAPCARAAMLLMACGAFLYSVFSVITPPASGFLSASFFNHAAVGAALGVNPDILSMAPLGAMGAGIWLYFFTYDTGCRIMESRKGRSGVLAVFAFALVFFAGRAFTGKLSAHAAEHLMNDVSAHAGLMATIVRAAALPAKSADGSAIRILPGPGEAKAFLAAPGGKILAASDEKYLMRPLWPDGSREDESVLGAEPRGGDRVSLSGGTFLVGREPVGRYGWTVVVLQGVEYVLVAEFMGMAVTAAMLLLSAMMLSAYVLSESARAQTEEALRLKAELSALEGIIPICASCKKIRDDKGYWNQVESYIARHPDSSFSHALCPACARKLYPKYYKEEDSKGDDR